MRVKYRLRPNTVREGGWVADPYEVDDDDVNATLRYGVLGAAGYGDTKDEAIAGMIRNLNAEKLKSQIRKERESHTLTEEREIEI